MEETYDNLYKIYSFVNLNKDMGKYRLLVLSPIKKKFGNVYINLNYGNTTGSTADTIKIRYPIENNNEITIENIFKKIIYDLNKKFGPIQIL